MIFLWTVVRWAIGWFYSVFPSGGQGEIPCYSYFFEWEVAREQEKEKAGKGKVISFYKNI